MSNGLLFDDLYSDKLATPPAPVKATARASDPQSSHDAAERMNASGAANNQRQQAIDLVWKHPGKSSLELAEFSAREDGQAALDRYQLARRLPEAQELGEVHRREPSGKNKAVTWWPGTRMEAKK